MHNFSEIGFFCSGHSASACSSTSSPARRCPASTPFGDMASVPHNYMLGAFVNGGIAGADAAAYLRRHEPRRLR